ncbi:MAG: RNA methyltransferase [Bacteroidales bacterium]|nr:RNA methyltransferase [Bacteroidales bacterium]
MISKADIKEIRSLSLKKYRDSLGLFVVEGEKIVEEALSSDFEVVKVFRTSDIGEEMMRRITLLSSPSPALAVVKIPDAGDAAAVREAIAAHNISLALDSVRDPGNMGTIVRIADWFGIEAIFASRDCVDIYNPKVVQATMGAIFRKKVIYCDLQDVLSQYREAGKPVYGTFLEGEDINSLKLSNEGIVVMGSESNGISEAVSKLVSQKLFIPPYPAGSVTSESLNVAVAAAITCAAFRR